MTSLVTLLSMSLASFFYFFFFFNDTATTEIYTLSLHDALPIWARRSLSRCPASSSTTRRAGFAPLHWPSRDRKSTRLNSSHTVISYAVFCLKKKKRENRINGDEAHRHHERARTV